VLAQEKAMIKPAVESALDVTLHDPAGNPVIVRLTEKQAAHLLEECARAFGWGAVNNPFTQTFLKTFTAALDIADKVEGGG
jgi:hypothetical protein